MGNTPSKSPPGQSGPSASGQPPQSNDYRVHHRKSIHALSGGKSSAADPSATRESATGQYANPQHTPVHQRLQSRNIPPETHTGRLERRDSRRDRGHYDARGSPNVPTERRTPEPSRAVQVPPTDRHAPQRPPVNTYYATPSHLSRPPRLPLPIGDAMSAPGSPIGASGSMGTTTTLDNRNLDVYRDKGSGDAIDDDDMTDELEEPYPMPGVNMAVPTTIEWHGDGEKVYVTGTFVNWARKFRLHKSEDKVFSTTLQLRPGTHHLKFIVDGVMRTEDHLPTAVDFTNHLVNYIEVSADDVQRSRRESDRQAKITIPPDIYPPKVIPESVHIKAARQAEAAEDSDKQEPAPEEEIPMGDFRAIIPEFLSDLDKEEHEEGYREAASIINDYPTPPMLPLFLGKSILNGSNGAKEDSSVLQLPNHTVLNHLATSSIKNGVLATSATTRYKRKYVTTILYKPTE